MNEPLEAARHGIAFVVSDLKAAHKSACEDGGLLEIALYDLLVEANTLQQRIFRVENAVNLQA